MVCYLCGLNLQCVYFFRSVGDRFDVSKSTLWVCFSRVVRALNKIAHICIKWPNIEERRIITNEFASIGNIPYVIGAIDGTYVPIKAPRQNPDSYINRKCFHGITLQAISHPSLQFIDCFTGYPSSVSDIRIFKNSDFYKNVLLHEDQYFQENQVILGDKAYPLFKWCLPPYIDRGNLGAIEYNFNKIHASMRQVVERSFALFFGRFRRMKYLDMNRTDMYAMTIMASCVLHNLCLLNENDNEIILNYIEEGIAIVRHNQQNAVDVDLNLLTNEGHNRRNNIAREIFQVP